MLTSSESARAQEVIAMKLPSYRKAYSDRMAWLMAYMSELAYLKFDKPNADSTITLNLVSRALKKARKGTATKIISAIRKSFDYDHEEQEQALKQSLDQVGWSLSATFSIDGTQGYVAYSEYFTALVFRGTETDRISDIRADAKATQTACPTGGRVHSGFNEQYNDVEARVKVLLADDEIKRKPLFIAGHSLGGAVATIATRRLNAQCQIAACYTFGSPRVGTEDWVAQIKTPIYRIVNSADPVPMVPFGGTIIFCLAKALRGAGRLIPWGSVLVSGGNWMERTMSGYAHAGNMRFLTDSKDGDLTKVELLFTVGWGRRLLGTLSHARWWKVLGDHSILLYRRKLMYVAENRNA